MNPHSITCKPLDEFNKTYYCYFCNARASKQMQRVYSFGAASDRVCDSCASFWKRKAKFKVSRERNQ